MEFLYLKNEKILEKIKEKIKYDKIIEQCTDFGCYIDYSKVYFFVDIDPKKLGFIYAMIMNKDNIDKSLACQTYAGVKINNIKSIFQLLDFLTKNENDDLNLNFVVYETFICTRLPDSFVFEPGDIINKFSEVVKIHKNDRIFSSYFNTFIYDLMWFTIDSYQDEQLFRKTFSLVYGTGELYLLESYPSFFQFAWNFFKNKLKHKNVTTDKEGNLYVKLHNE